MRTANPLRRQWFRSQVAVTLGHQAVVAALRRPDAERALVMLLEKATRSSIPLSPLPEIPKQE